MATDQQGGSMQGFPQLSAPIRPARPEIPADTNTILRPQRFQFTQLVDRIPQFKDAKSNAFRGNTHNVTHRPAGEIVTLCRFAVLLHALSTVQNHNDVCERLIERCCRHFFRPLRRVSRANCGQRVCDKQKLE